MKFNEGSFIPVLKILITFIFFCRTKIFVLLSLGFKLQIFAERELAKIAKNIVFVKQCILHLIEGNDSFQK